MAWCLVFLFPVSARAVTSQFQAFDLWPTVGDPYFFYMSSSQGLHPWQYAFQIDNSFMYRPLEAINTDGTRARSVIDYAIGHFISAGLGVTDFWQLGATIPVFSQARFQDVKTGSAIENVFKIGDLRLTSKVRLINSYRHRWGLAIEPFGTIPLGAHNKYLGETPFTGGLNILGEVLLTSKIRAALNAGIQMLGENVRIRNIDFQHRFLSSLGLSARLGHGLTASAESHADTSLKDFFSRKDEESIEFVGGVKWDVAQSGLSIGVGGGTCAVCGARGAKARGFLNIDYKRMNQNYRLKDIQEDKWALITLGEKSENQILAEEIVTLKDHCPADASEYNPAIHDPDCAKFFKFRKSIVSLSKNISKQKFAEVFLDLKKNCPADPKDFDPAVHDAGCPKYFELKNQIVALTGQSEEVKFAEVFLALKDNCPKDPSQFDPAMHDAACPKYFELKREVLPLMAKTDEEKRAIEFILLSDDRDHDGIPDALDECPKDPEDIDGIADEDGCPEGMITIANGEVRTIAPVHFAFDKISLSRQARVILSHLSDSLFTHPEIHSLEIIGHADPVGARALNQYISKRRAEVVVNYLRLRGIPDDLELIPLGVGDRQPIAPNTTPQGRRLNRRVEFLIRK